MKTITFYSYKGGVGRSLALSNIAIRLSELNAKVCVLDFDLDAPGLRFKFKDYTLETEIKSGIVDYIYDFSSNGKTDRSIGDMCVKLMPPNQLFSAINFISAGDIESPEYWKKLSMIKWADMFYGSNPNGVRFFLDLKSKIEKEIAPDYLLIDSRTGITDISGITLRLLADQAIVLAVNNMENLFGSKKIIKNLLSKSFPGKIPNVNFVLTRLPYTSAEIELEELVIENVKEEFKQFLGIEEFDISVIHSDVRLQIEESHLIGKKYESKSVSISNDYLNLFDLITADTLNSNDKAARVREAELEYGKFLNMANAKEKNNALRIEQITKAIELDNTKYIYYAYRGVEFYQNNEIEKAIADYNSALELNKKDVTLYYNLGFFYQLTGRNDEALECLTSAESYGDQAFLLKAQIYSKLGKADMALEFYNKTIEVNPLNDTALNARANILRQKGEFKQAFEDISKAIEQDTDNAVYFATLAEIYASEEKLDEFYLNFSIALSKGLSSYNMSGVKDIYSRFANEEKFKAMLKKHNISIDSLLK